MIDKTMCEVLWRNISDFYVNLRIEVAAVSRDRYGVEKTVDKKSEIFRHKTSHMVLSTIFLEDKHNILLHLSIFYEYQQFFQHRICFSIQPQLQFVNLHRNRRYFVIKLTTLLRKNCWNELIWVTGHCNRAAVSRNRYGVEKTVDTHKILINEIKFYVCAIGY
jgi:hypothetical protein